MFVVSNVYKLYTLIMSLDVAWMIYLVVVNRVIPGVWTSFVYLVAFLQKLACFTPVMALFPAR